MGGLSKFRDLLLHRSQGLPQQGLRLTQAAVQLHLSQLPADRLLRRFYLRLCRSAGFAHPPRQLGGGFPVLSGLFELFLRRRVRRFDRRAGMRQSAAHWAGLSLLQSPGKDSGLLVEKRPVHLLVPGGSLPALFRRPQVFSLQLLKPLFFAGVAFHFLFQLIQLRFS